MVRCDTDRMQQVFWNLLTNSVKFTPRGGQVTVRVEQGDHLARVSVTDTGTGIEPEALPHVFQRFWQGRKREQPSDGRPRAGTCAGAALRRAARRHDLGRQRRPRAGRHLHGHTATSEIVKFRRQWAPTGASPPRFGRFMSSTSGIITRKTTPSSRKIVTNDTIDACRMSIPWRTT